MISKSQPKARFSNRLASGDFLTLAVWRGRKDPKAEVLTIQIRHSSGGSWETIGRLAVYRTADGAYSLLPERLPLKKTPEVEVESQVPDENERSEDALET